MKYFYFFAVAILVGSCHTPVKNDTATAPAPPPKTAEERYLDSLVKANPGKSINISISGVKAIENKGIKHKTDSTAK